MKNIQKLADVNLFGGSGGFAGPGPLGNPGANAGNLFNDVVSVSIGVMTSIAFIWFTIKFITGAISFISSSGDKAKVAEAQKKLTWSVLGLVMVVSAIFIADFVGYLFGFDILDPGKYLGL